MTDFIFLTSARGGLATGDAYTRRLAASLRAAGHGATLHAPEAAGQGGKGPGGEASWWDRLPEGGIPVVDETLLPGCAGCPGRLAQRRALGLFRHGGSAGVPASVLAALAGLVTGSAAIAERLRRERGTSPPPVIALPPGADPAPRAAGSGGPGCALLALGALTPAHGHDLLLRALAALPDLDWRLVIAGDDQRDPTHAAALRDLAHSLGIAPRVTFAGAVDDTALAALWHGSDLFAHAARSEAHGMAVAEALRHGLPVATLAGTEHVPQEAGVIAPPGDWAGLSKAMRRLIFDARLRQDMAESAWHAGQALPDWQTQARAFLRAVEETQRC